LKDHFLCAFNHLEREWGSVKRRNRRLLPNGVRQGGNVEDALGVLLPGNSGYRQGLLLVALAVAQNVGVGWGNVAIRIQPEMQRFRFEREGDALYLAFEEADRDIRR
jgi:hypothetical protein